MKAYNCVRFYLFWGGFALIDPISPDLNSVLDGMIARCTVEGQSKYMCQSCGKTMDNRAKIKRHAEIHLDMSHSCIVCQKVFKTRNVLATHYTREHPEVTSPWTMH